VAGQRLQHEGAVLRGARHGPGVIERPRERDHAGPAHPPVGRLEPGDAAEGGRTPDGSAGVGAERAHRQAGGQGRAGAAARAARDVIEVPRVARGRKPVARKLDAEGELVGDQLAEHDHAGPLQARHAGAVRVGHPVGQERGARGGADAPGRVEVLVGDRDAGEWAGVAARERGLRGAGVGERALRGDRHVGVESLVERLDAAQQVGRVVHRPELAAAEQAAQLPDPRVTELVGAHEPDSAPPFASTSA